MSRRKKLTWQGRDDGAGRWKKVYRGRVHYFSGGSGKSDLDAYRKAVSEWEHLKVTLDQEADANKPYRVEYESAISEWQSVLTWGRDNNDVAIVGAATAKISNLRRRFESRTPTPISRRFDLPLCKFGMSAGTAMIPPAQGDAVTAGEAMYLANELSVPEELELDQVQQIINRFFVGRTWRERIARELRKAENEGFEHSLKTMTDLFISKRGAGEISAGGLANLGRHFSFLTDELGEQFDVRGISGKTVDLLHSRVLKAVEDKRFSRASARDLQSSIRSFIQWLWEIDLLAELPRNLKAKSHRILVEHKEVRSFSIETVRKIFGMAKERLRLYILLALNCGMTQIDISDLQPTQVDEAAKTLSRKRGKTKQFESVPTVIYSLWPETLDLLKKYGSADQDRLLLAPNGGPLKYEVQRNGKVAKNDYIGLTFHRMLKSEKLTGQFKMLKKTSATLLRNHPIFSGLEGVFLDHAPRTMSDKHYAEVPTQLLAEAISWLRQEYKFPLRG